MKRFTKIILVLAGFCFIFGTAITVAAASLGGRIPAEVAMHDDWYNGILFHVANPSHRGQSSTSRQDTLVTIDQELSDEWVVESEKLGAETLDQASLRELKISVEASRLEILEEEGADSIYIRDASNFIRWDRQMDDDTLELKFYREDERRFFSDSPSSAVLVIPKGYEFHEVELSVGAGSIQAETIRARELDLEAGAGMISINSGQSQQLNIDCQAGSVVYSGEVGVCLETDCQAGNVAVSLKGKPEDFNCELEVNAGSIHIGQQKYSGLNKEKTLIYEGAQKEAELDCGAGSIKISFFE